MVSLRALLTTTALLLSSSSPFVAAEYLAVIESNVQLLLGSASIGSASCVSQAPLYEIHSFSSHPGAVGSGCSWKGTNVASSRTKQGTSMDGCHGGYSNGWSVCITSYGGNVHDGKGNHQRCLTDDATLLNCPNPICWTSKVRKLRCDGVWRKDGS